MAIDSVIFGFGYRARSGKDTAVAEIIKQRGLLKSEEMYNIHVVPQKEPDFMLYKDSGWQDRYDIRKYSFADALRREVDTEARKAGGMERLFAYSHCFPKKGYVVTLPEWVQYDPNGEMNAQYPLGKQRTLLQWWGTEYRRSDDDNYWVKRLAEQIELEKPQIALITDMRFPNEMAFALQYGETVRVDRDGLPPSTHASETALQDVSDENWSIILENSGSLEDFKIGAVVAFDELLCNFPFGCNKHSVA